MSKYPVGELYRVVLGSHIDTHWRFLFDGMEIKQEGKYSSLTGYISDQAQLFGLLKKIQNAGVRLVAIYPVYKPNLTAFFN